MCRGEGGKNHTNYHLRARNIYKEIFKNHASVTIPANTSRWANASSMLTHRLRRWPSIELALANGSCLLWWHQRVSLEIWPLQVG